MQRRSLAILLSIVLSGCAGYDATKGYDGPKTTISDSYSPAPGSSALNFFIVTKINGHKVDNSVETTAQVSYGNGNAQFPVSNVHPIRATTPTVITIEAVTHYGMPILSLVNKTYDVSGDVSFTPQVGNVYVVKGTLGDAGSVVWIENGQGQIQGRKIESGAASR